MRIAFVSDEPADVHQNIREILEKRGHEISAFGAIASGEECPWVPAAEEAARAVASGECDEGVFLCWTGTGVSMVANKIGGIRAALCTDPETASGARVWNHANVICLSNRSLTPAEAERILSAWFDTDPGSKGQEGVRQLKELDRSTRSQERSA